MPPLVRAPAVRLTVDGQPAPALEADLLRLEVEHDTDGLSRLEATFRCWGSLAPDEAPGLHHMSGRTIGLGRELRVELGERDALVVVFSGWVSAVEGGFQRDRAPELRVRAEDALLRLRLGQRTRLFEGATDGDIARRIAADHGLRASVDAEGASHEALLSVNQTDLSLLRQRARAADARIGAVDRALQLSAEGPAAAPPVVLSTLDDLVELNVSADLAHQRTEVRVHGWSVADKAPIHASAASDTLRVEAPVGASGPALLEALGVEAVEQHALEFPATEAEAEALARALMLQRGRRFLTARGATSGTPALRVGGGVEIVDAGPWFTGLYRVRSLRHTYDATRGLSTRFVADRAALGGGL